MEMVTISRAEYEDLKAQNQWLLEQLRVLKSKRFGSSSEKASDGDCSVTPRHLVKT